MDINYIAVAYSNAPCFTLLKWDETNLTKADDYTLAGTGRGCSFSPNGEYIAVGHYGSPYFTLLKWDGANLTKADDYTLPFAGYSCSFSPSGNKTPPQRLKLAKIKAKPTFLYLLK